MISVCDQIAGLARSEVVDMQPPCGFEAFKRSWDVFGFLQFPPLRSRLDPRSASGGGAGGLVWQPSPGDPKQLCKAGVQEGED